MIDTKTAYLGDTLRQRREALGLAAADVAAVVCMTLDRYKSIEGGQPAAEVQRRAIGLALERLASGTSRTAKVTEPARAVADSPRHTSECCCPCCERNGTGLYALLAALSGDSASLARLGPLVAEALPSLRRRGRRAA